MALDKQLELMLGYMMASESVLCNNPMECPSSWTTISVKQVAFWAYWSAVELSLKMTVPWSHFLNCVPLTVRVSDEVTQPDALARVPPELLNSSHGSMKVIEIWPTPSGSVS